MKTPRFLALAALLGGATLSPSLFADTAIQLDKLYSGSLDSCQIGQTYTYNVGATKKLTLRFTGQSEQHLASQTDFSSNDWQNTFNLLVSDNNGQAVNSAYLESGNIELQLDNTVSSINISVSPSQSTCDATIAKHYSLELQPYSLKSVSIGGIVSDAAKIPVEGATVTVYDADMRFAGVGTTNLAGSYLVPLRPGIYYARVSKGPVDFWMSGSPLSSASAIDVRKDKVKRNITLSDARPNITGISGEVSQGLQVVISGAGFGKSRGYVDFGGTITGSSANITDWTDTLITVKAPTNAYGNCVRVFSKAGGYSECYDATQATLPTATITVNKTSVTEGQTITYTLKLNAASQYDANIKLSFSGTAKAHTSTTPGDYNKPSLPITIPAGQTQATFTITPFDDGLQEDPETLTVSLSTTGSGYTVGATGKSAKVTIIDP